MIAIKVSDVSKSFKVYGDGAKTLKERALFRKRNSFSIHHVLKNINLTIEKGDVVGLIGQNGCGKSTLLKLMTRILYPDKGKIEVNGRVSSLLELGAGFHPDLSGRDNIYTNAAIFGLKKHEIDARLKDIIEFSELEEYIDNPVRTYSSGMYMRLAFSVAINVDADILLIDEILAVGDANFQAKCYARLNELKKKGITIVIVTHDSGIVKSFCNKAVWINEGEIVQSGHQILTVDAYLDYMKEKQKKQLEKQLEEERLHPKIKEWEILGIDVVDEKGTKDAEILSGTSMKIEVNYKTTKPTDNNRVEYGIFSKNGDTCYKNTTDLNGEILKNAKESGKFVIEIPCVPMLGGEYIFSFKITDDIRSIVLDECEKHFFVVSQDTSAGVCVLQHKWDII